VQSAQLASITKCSWEWGQVIILVLTFLHIYVIINKKGGEYMKKTKQFICYECAKGFSTIPSDWHSISDNHRGMVLKGKEVVCDSCKKVTSIYRNTKHIDFTEDLYNSMPKTGLTQSLTPFTRRTEYPIYEVLSTWHKLIETNRIQIDGRSSRVGLSSYHKI